MSVAGHEDDRRNEAWTEIARRILEGATGPERCPLNDDGDLVVECEPAGMDGERYTVYCPSCDARTFIDMATPKAVLPDPTHHRRSAGEGDRGWLLIAHCDNVRESRWRGCFSWERASRVSARVSRACS